MKTSESVAGSESLVEKSFTAEEIFIKTIKLKANYHIFDNVKDQSAKNCLVNWTLYMYIYT